MCSQGKSPWLLLVLLLSMAVPVLGQSCARECICFDDFASCSQVSSFPRLPSNIKELTLSMCNLTSLSRGPLQALTSLKTLEIQSCTLDTLGSGAFEGLSNMDYFTISQSTITQIQDGAFSNMTNITSFLFFLNTIGEIQSNAFRDLSRMDDFAFRSNKIGRVSPNAWNKISHIKDLQFTDNTIEELQTGAFWDVKNITTSVVFQNRVAKMECGTFDVIIPVSKASNFNENSFSCSCALSWIFYNPLLESFQNNNCTFLEDPDSPVSLRTVKEADLKCPVTATPMERGCSVLPEFRGTTSSTPVSPDRSSPGVNPATNAIPPTAAPPSQSPNKGSSAAETAVTSSKMVTTSKPSVTEAGSTEVIGMSTRGSSDRPTNVVGQSSSPNPSAASTLPSATIRQPEVTRKQGSTSPSVATSGPRGAAASRDRAGSVGKIMTLLVVLAMLVRE